MSMLDTVDGALLVHAHPDDETIATGGLIAELVARDREVWLLTASRGERGEVVPGPLSPLEGTADLVDRREQELRGALDVLGVAGFFWLGEPPARAAGRPPRRYRDSGMAWIRPGLAGPADDVDGEALVAAPLEETTGDISALIGHLHPSLVISYARDGGYGHPDHIRVHEAALAASRACRTPFAEIVAAPAPDAEWFDLEGRIETVRAALRCHASQVRVEGTDIVHSGGQRERIRASVGLRLVA